MKEQNVKTSQQEEIDSQIIEVKEEKRGKQDISWEMSAERALQVNYLTKVNRSISIIK